MTDPVLLGPWVRRFLLEHLVGERNLARKALANCELRDDQPRQPWRDDKGLMEFLSNL